MTNLPADSPLHDPSFKKLFYLTVVSLISGNAAIRIVFLATHFNIIEPLFPMRELTSSITFAFVMFGVVYGVVVFIVFCLITRIEDARGRFYQVITVMFIAFLLGYIWAWAFIGLDRLDSVMAVSFLVGLPSAVVAAWKFKTKKVEFSPIASATPVSLGVDLRGRSVTELYDLSEIDVRTAIRLLTLATNDYPEEWLAEYRELWFELDVLTGLSEDDPREKLRPRISEVINDLEVKLKEQNI